MQVTVTENDKRLLVYLAIFCLIILPFWYVLRPAVSKGTEIKAELDAANEQRTKIEAQIVRYQNDRAALEQNRQLYAQQISDLNVVMPNNRIDSMITDIATNCGLEITKLSISRNDNLQNEEPYEHSQIALGTKSAENAGKVNAEESQPALYITGVNITVKGSENNVYRFMDAISSRSPALRATTYSVTREPKSGVVTLIAAVNVYMVEDNLAVDVTTQTATVPAEAPVDETEKS